MRLAYALVVLLSANLFTFGQSAAFLDQMLKAESGRSDYFIPLRIKSDSYTGMVIVTSRDLFDLLNSTKGFDVTRYETFVVDLLKSNRDLTVPGAKVDKSGFFLTGANLREGGFRIVNASQDFENVAAQGCEQLIRHYFSPSLPESKENSGKSCRCIVFKNAQDLLIRPKTNFAEQNNVIAALFAMDIGMYRDDISGSLAIGYTTLK